MKKVFIAIALLWASLSWAGGNSVPVQAQHNVAKPSPCFIKVDSRYLNVAFIQQFYVAANPKAVVLLLQGTNHYQDNSHRIITVATPNPEAYAAQLAGTIAECGR